MYRFPSWVALGARTVCAICIDFAAMLFCPQYFRSSSCDNSIASCTEYYFRFRSECDYTKSHIYSICTAARSADRSADRFIVIALKQIQKERPSYIGPTGHEGWWKEVIRRTAVGAGAPTSGVWFEQIILLWNSNCSAHLSSRR